MPGKGPLFQKLDSSEGTFGWFLHSSNKASITKKSQVRLQKKKTRSCQLPFLSHWMYTWRLANPTLIRSNANHIKCLIIWSKKNSSLQALPKFFTYTIVLPIILPVGSLPITINPVYDNSSNQVFSQIIQNLNSKCHL